MKLCEIRRKIEEQENVKIIMAIESGSRAWGFASPDSDYDVRFIYVRKETDYLKLEKFRDVIEWKLDDVLDINGWDIRKASKIPAIDAYIQQKLPEIKALAEEIDGKVSDWDALNELFLRMVK